MKILRKFFSLNVKASAKFDRILSDKYLLDGNLDFMDNLVPKYLKAEQKILDIGGGKNPTLDAKTKNKFKSYIIGIDIDEDELLKAPAGIYDDIISSPIEKYKGDQSADLIICRTVLEHVENNEESFKAIANALRAGGVCILFVPNKNALFARLNLLIPEKIKRKLLFAIWPSMERDHGFPAYYHQCRPDLFEALAETYHLEIVEERLYFTSIYFAFFFPLHFTWRLWLLISSFFSERRYCETFSMVLRKT